jgi:hypothetical protein
MHNAIRIINEEKKGRERERDTNKKTWDSAMLVYGEKPSHS